MQTATTTTETLILDGEGYNLIVAPEAEAMKQELIARAQEIQIVNDPAASDAAKARIKELASVRIAVEKCRNSVKKPIIQIGKDIDAKAKEYLAEIQVEEDRLSKKVGDYALAVEEIRRKALREAEERRRKEAEEARLLEEQRLRAEREKEAAEKAAREAEWADDEETKAKAAEAEAKAKLESEEAERKAKAAEEQSKAAPIVLPQSVGGTKMQWDFEVVDMDKLAHSRPDFVTITEKRKEILSFLNAVPTSNEELPNNCAGYGLRVFLKPIVSTR